MLIFATALSENRTLRSNACLSKEERFEYVRRTEDKIQSCDQEALRVPMSCTLSIQYPGNDVADTGPALASLERDRRGEPAQSYDRFGQQRANMAKVLVVDDNRAGRDLIRAILKSLPCEIVEASHGQQGLDLLQRERPDLVLLDIDMPGMDGLEVVGRIRQDAKYAELPVIAVTAFAMDGDREKAMAAGFTDYVTKPVRAAGLRQTVQELLGRLKD